VLLLNACLFKPIKLDLLTCELINPPKPNKSRISCLGHVIGYLQWFGRDCTSSHEKEGFKLSEW
jgi:hypothetical protein